MMKREVTALIVEVARSGRWWAIRVPSMPTVFSQCRRLEQVDAFAREAIALALGCGEDQIGALDVHIRPPDEAAALLAEVERTSDAARAAAITADDARRRAVLRLTELGYPTRDVGALLGLSHQRVSQLLAAAS